MNQQQLKTLLISVMICRQHKKGLNLALKKIFDTIIEAFKKLYNRIKSFINKLLGKRGDDILYVPPNVPKLLDQLERALTAYENASDKLNKLDELTSICELLRNEDYSNDNKQGYASTVKKKYFTDRMGAISKSIQDCTHSIEALKHNIERANDSIQIHKEIREFAGGRVKEVDDLTNNLDRIDTNSKKRYQEEIKVIQGLLKAYTMYYNTLNFVYMNAHN